MGQAGGEQIWVQGLAGRKGVDASVRHPTWRRRTGGFRVPADRARFVRWTCENPEPEQGREIVEINLYAPADAASTLEEGRVAALGHGSIKLLAGESITVDLGHARSVVGALVEWGETYGTVFSAHLSDDGEEFLEIGRIDNRRRRQRQLLVALHDQPLSSLDRA